MPVTIPWHSVKETVHHNNTKCSVGTSMDPDYRRGGTGGKRLCDECARLDEAGDPAAAATGFGRDRTQPPG